MDRGVFFALLGFGVVAVAAWLLLLLLWPFLGAIAWAGVLGLAAQPLHRSLLRWTRGRRNPAALASTALTVFVVAVPLFTLGVLFAAEAVGVLGAPQKAVAAGKVPGREAILATPWVSDLLAKIEPLTRGMDFRAAALAALRTATSFAAGLSTSLIGGVISGLIQFLVMVLLLFFCFRDGPRVVGEAWAAVPIKDRDKELLEATVTRVVTAVLYGIVLSCVAQGVLGGVGFALTGVPSPVFFGAIMIVAAFIPVVGPALVWVPAVIYLAAVGEYGRAGMLLGWCVVVVSSVDNFLKPFFISGRAGIPLLVVALGVLGGLVSLGFLGVILGPLFFCLFLEVFRIYREGLDPASGGTAGEEP